MPETIVNKSKIQKHKKSWSSYKRWDLIKEALPGCFKYSQKLRCYVLSDPKDGTILDTFDTSSSEKVYRFMNKFGIPNEHTIHDIDLLKTLQEEVKMSYISREHYRNAEREYNGFRKMDICEKTDKEIIQILIELGFRFDGDDKIYPYGSNKHALHGLDEVKNFIRTWEYWEEMPRYRGKKIPALKFDRNMLALRIWGSNSPLPKFDWKNARKRCYNNNNKTTSDENNNDNDEISIDDDPITESSSDDMSLLNDDVPSTQIVTDVQPFNATTTSETYMNKIIKKSTSFDQDNQDQRGASISDYNIPEHVPSTASCVASKIQVSNSSDDDDNNNDEEDCKAPAVDHDSIADSFGDDSNQTQRGRTFRGSNINARKIARHKSSRPGGLNLTKSIISKVTSKQATPKQEPKSSTTVDSLSVASTSNQKRITAVTVDKENSKKRSDETNEDDKQSQQLMKKELLGKQIPAQGEFVNLKRKAALDSGVIDKTAQSKKISLTTFEEKKKNDCKEGDKLNDAREKATAVNKESQPTSITTEEIRKLKLDTPNEDMDDVVEVQKQHDLRRRLKVIRKRNEIITYLDEIGLGHIGTEARKCRSVSTDNLVSSNLKLQKCITNELERQVTEKETELEDNADKQDKAAAVDKQSQHQPITTEQTIQHETIAPNADVDETLEEEKQHHLRLRLKTLKKREEIIKDLDDLGLNYLSTEARKIRAFKTYELLSSNHEFRKSITNELERQVMEEENQIENGSAE